MNQPNAIVRVHRPVLTAEERAKRMDAIKQAAANLVKASMIHRRENNT